MRTKTSLACCLVAALVLAALAVAPGSAQAGPTTVIVIGNEPFPCKIIKHDEKTITVYLIDLKTTTKLEWQKLPPMERRRLQYLVKAQELDTDKPLGKKIDGVEVLMKNGMIYRGIELADRKSPSHLYIRCPRVSFMGISRGDVDKVTPIKIFEGQIYTSEERYRTRLAVSPPKTAEEHFRTAEWCRDNELPTEARDHLAKAQLLDEAYEPRCAAQKDAIDALARKQQARTLYGQLLRDKAAGRYGKVLKAAAQLEQIDPDFEELTKLKMELPILIEKRKSQLRREVVGLYYSYMDHFVRECAYTRKSDTPAEPVTFVTLKSGFEVQGRLRGSPDADVVQLENEGRIYQIKREHILRIETKMVEKGPFRWRTLAECSKYVKDTKGGVTADIVAAIGKELEIEDKQVQEIWAGRLADVIEIGPDGAKTPTLVTAYQDAHWGLGSWLSDHFTGDPGTGASPGGAAGSTPGLPGTGGGRTGGNRTNTNRTTVTVGPGGQTITIPTGGAPNNRGGNQQQSQQPQWDDPETWWAKQTPRTKSQILRAMCAEAIMKVEKVYREPCINCGGTGFIEHMAVGAGGGGRFRYACSTCRGTGDFYGVSYR